MPHFSECCEGADTYICQRCGRIRCGSCQPGKWRPDITGNSSAANVCMSCIEEVDKPAKTDKLLSLVEHCRRESGLEGPALNRYINRYYGHG